MCLAVPMQVKRVEGHDAVVEQAGAALNIRTDLLDEVAAGDYVLVHAGYAIQRVDEDEARETLALLRMFGIDTQTGQTTDATG
ncbi:MAG: HypC/HybG/HupF family hydrogenase formation chaperone [Armatimonadetes bacterium]|jgi:hydrogenase expression/formation protein HypC|nr:HypC/HybG/HupF family hydrogenase formation chaperone [Armatimonadota bacterium]